MKKIFILLILNITICFSQNEYIWDYSSEGIEGHYNSSILEYEGKLYNFGNHIISYDTASSWLPLKYKSYLNGDTIPDNYYLPKGSFQRFCDWTFLSINSRLSFSKNLLNWQNHSRTFNNNTFSFNFSIVIDSSLILMAYINNKKQFQTLIITKNIIESNSDKLVLNIDSALIDIAQKDTLIDYFKSDKNLYATIKKSSKYYYSTDKGMNWIKDSIPENNSNIKYFYFLNNKLYAISDTGIWKQNNNMQWEYCTIDDQIHINYTRKLLISYKNQIITNSLLNDTIPILIASADEGKTWQRFGNSDFDFNSLVSLGDKLIGSNYSGVIVSSDNGSNWIESNKGIFNPSSENSYHNNEIIKSNNECLTSVRNVLLVNTAMKSYDGGKTWVKKRIDPSRNFQLSSNFSFYITQTKWGLFAFNRFMNLVYKSTDFGETWNFFSEDVGIIYNSKDRAIFKKDSIFYFNAKNFIFLSIDQGKTFSLIDSTTLLNSKLILMDSCSVWNIMNNKVYLKNNRLKIYESDDIGKTYQYKGQITLPDSSNQIELKFFNNDGIIFQPMSSSLFRSVYYTKDYGTTLKKIKLPGDTLYYPTRWFKVHNKYYIFYVFEYMCKIYESEDLEKWTLISEDLGYKIGKNLFVTDEYLFVSTYEGLFRLKLDLSKIVETEELRPMLPYPNPVINILSFKYVYSSAKKVKVYSLTGIEYEFPLISENTIDVSILPKGVYVAELIFEGGWSIKKKFMKI